MTPIFTRNNRYKDVQLYRLLRRRRRQRRIPGNRRTCNKRGARSSACGPTTRRSRTARPSRSAGKRSRWKWRACSCASYVAGNVDGPAHNRGNGGFARFADASGREVWRGVVIDNGAAWHTLPDDMRPWNADALDTGPVTADHLPMRISSTRLKRDRRSLERRSRAVVAVRQHRRRRPQHRRRRTRPRSRSARPLRHRVRAGPVSRRGEPANVSA